MTEIVASYPLLRSELDLLISMIYCLSVRSTIEATLAYLAFLVGSGRGIYGTESKRPDWDMEWECGVEMCDDLYPNAISAACRLPNVSLFSPGVFFLAGLYWYELIDHISFPIFIGVFLHRFGGFVSFPGTFYQGYQGGYQGVSRGTRSKKHTHTWFVIGLPNSSHRAKVQSQVVTTVAWGGI